eukprot:CAMPEP_0172940892 /NCGR_PEP_ID=MMETSP1075-20121228/224266_1 /TAXON_ID=2916 /ORGANISM="Ceratium fusus, Strain PA161109" /LENGTH=160 /DNA_ID=CAMNT_0013802301 /DNA_START=763 /DNA_END=1245 /DNA_ORIENTATION=+
MSCLQFCGMLYEPGWGLFLLVAQATASSPAPSLPPVAAAVSLVLVLPAARARARRRKQWPILPLTPRPDSTTPDAASAPCNDLRMDLPRKTLELKRHRWYLTAATASCTPLLRAPLAAYHHHHLRPCCSQDRIAFQRPCNADTAGLQLHEVHAVLLAEAQ